MMAAELEEKTDEDGMPANYRAKALESANTNITMVLFAIAFIIQFLATSSLVTGDLITRNPADDLVKPYYTAVAFFVLPVIYYKIHQSRDESSRRIAS